MRQGEPIGSGWQVVRPRLGIAAREALRRAHLSSGLRSRVPPSGSTMRDRRDVIGCQRQITPDGVPAFSNVGEARLPPQYRNFRQPPECGVLLRSPGSVWPAGT